MTKNYLRKRLVEYWQNSGPFLYQRSSDPTQDLPREGISEHISNYTLNDDDSRIFPHLGALNFLFSPIVLVILYFLFFRIPRHHSTSLQTMDVIGNYNNQKLKNVIEMYNRLSHQITFLINFKKNDTSYWNSHCMGDP